MDTPKETMKTAKQILRNRMKTMRKELSSRYCTEADRHIFLNLKSTDVYQKSNFLFCYVSLAEEVDTRRIIDEALKEGKQVAVPRCQRGGRMEAYEIKGFYDLKEGFRGILEPKEHCRHVSPHQLDLCIIPCLACSEEGIRLGYGGGYYDRYLPETRAFRVLLCREMQVCQDIPAESHDCSMNLLITEKRIIFC